MPVRASIVQEMEEGTPFVHVQIQSLEIGLALWIREHIVQDIFGDDTIPRLIDIPEHHLQLLHILRLLL